MKIHEIDCDMGVDCSCVDWPTYEEFKEECTRIRAVSDSRGETEVLEDAWQTNVMVRVTSDEGQHLDLEPMLLNEERTDAELARDAKLEFESSLRRNFPSKGS